MVKKSQALRSSKENVHADFAERAARLRSGGWSHQEIGQFLGADGDGVAETLAASGDEERIMSQIAARVDAVPRIDALLAEGLNVRRLSDVYNIKPLRLLQVYLRIRQKEVGRRLPSLAKPSRRDIGRMQQAFRDGATLSSIASMHEMTEDDAKKYVHVKDNFPARDYWDRRGRPENFLELYHQPGQTSRGLARALACAPKHARALCLEHGLASDVAYAHQRRQKKAIDPEVVQREYKRGATPAQIAATTGASMLQVRAHMQAAGLYTDAWLDDAVTSLHGLGWSAGRSRKVLGLTATELSSRATRLCIHGWVEPPHKRKQTARGLPPRSEQHRRRIMMGKTMHRFDISPERFSDLGRLQKVIARLRTLFHLRSLATPEFEAMVVRVYNDPAFAAVFCHWTRQPSHWTAVSADHIIPKAKGGRNDLDNIRFVTYFENRCKEKRTLEEWGNFKKDTKHSSDLFVENILEMHKNCACQQDLNAYATSASHPPPPDNSTTVIHPATHLHKR